MKYTLQLHGENQVYPVPEGLHELLADITREVLRAQPEQIVPFISDYLSALLITREAAKDAIKIVEDTLDSDLMKYCVTLKAPPEKVLWATKVIQRALRRYFAKKHTRLLKKSLMGFKKLKKGQPPEQTTEEHLDMLSSFLRKHDITYLQAHYAAIVIQRAWRGYQLRKTLKTKRPGLQQGIIVSDEIKPELEKYAPSWANSWLTLFEKAEPPVSPFPKGKIYPVKRPSHVYLPRREISVNRHHLRTLFSEGMDSDEKICDQTSSRGASTPIAAFSNNPPICVKSDDESIHDESAIEYGEEFDEHFYFGEEEEGYVVDHESSSANVSSQGKINLPPAPSVETLTGTPRRDSSLKKQPRLPSGGMSSSEREEHNETVTDAEEIEPDDLGEEI